MPQVCTRDLECVSLFSYYFLEVFRVEVSHGARTHRRRSLNTLRQARYVLFILNAAMYCLQNIYEKVSNSFFPLQKVRVRLHLQYHRLRFKGHRTGRATILDEDYFGMACLHLLTLCVATVRFGLAATSQPKVGDEWRGYFIQRTDIGASDSF
jgi:hypothetical protein